ncbi:hypothetical protein FRC17_000133 [Serendipita sp. 399]|nr:hypothetical protein FRC17_000133 [Serendipita sp. 399]
MKIAVEGCCHGELDKTYAELARIERETNQKADALIICGDFQAIRNQSDLLCMAVPQKYRQLGQFHHYYTGKKVAPVLTLVIGGNHEASNYMWELYHGGWLAPNIYYLGGSNCVRLNGVRIAGCSGIYKDRDYHMGHFETIPYDNSALRSVYHVRAYDVLKLSLLTPGLGVCISHDWPEGIYKHGDVKWLISKKPFFEEDINKGELGNPYMMETLRTLRPQWWLSAHLHVRFQAEVRHTGNDLDQQQQGSTSKGSGVLQQQNEKRLNSDEIVMEEEDEPAEPVKSTKKPQEPLQQQNADEIVMEDEDDPPVPSTVESTQPPASSTTDATSATSIVDPLTATTKFLALDKCVPRRRFLEIIDVSTPVPVPDHAPPKLTFDPEWLAISRAMHPLLSTERRSTVPPRLSLAQNWVQKELEWIKDRLKQKKAAESSPQAEAASGGGGGDEAVDLEISSIQQFVMTAPGPSRGGGGPPLLWYTNPQTEAFCDLIGVENKVNCKPI